MEECTLTYSLFRSYDWILIIILFILDFFRTHTQCHMINGVIKGTRGVELHRRIDARLALSLNGVLHHHDRRDDGDDWELDEFDEPGQVRVVNAAIGTFLSTLVCAIVLTSCFV